MPLLVKKDSSFLMLLSCIIEGCISKKLKLLTANKIRVVPKILDKAKDHAESQPEKNTVPEKSNHFILLLPPGFQVCRLDSCCCYRKSPHLPSLLSPMNAGKKHWQEP